jgi:glycosyltransferase involved in cell wall biosynthesis
MLSAFSASRSPARPAKQTIATSVTAASRLLLFELSVGGHYPSYVQHLITYWQEQNLPGVLDVLVTPQFLIQHQDVVQSVQARSKRSQILFHTITLAEAKQLADRNSALGRLRRNFQEWNLLQKYAEKFGSKHAFIPYLDTRFLPIALGQKLPCTFSGIYFRPTWHYNKLQGLKSTWKTHLSKFILHRILAQTQLTQIFCLDSFAVDSLKRQRQGLKTLPIADPVQTFPKDDLRTQALKRQLGIDRDRQVFLLFGAINHRKGIHQLLDSLELLTPKEMAKTCILIVGTLADAPDAAQIRHRINALSHYCPAQIIHVENYVPESDIPHYFQLSDVVLAIYQRHVGMSGILVRAAIAQKPVLSSDYGLMGAVTKRHQLGKTIDSTSPSEIAHGIGELLVTPLKTVGDRKLMQKFGEQNSPQRFAQTVFRSIWQVS